MRTDARTLRHCGLDPQSPVRNLLTDKKLKRKIIIFAKAYKNINMLGFEGKKEVIKGEEAAKVLVRLSNALSGKPSKEDIEAEKTFAKAREKYTVVWK